MIRDYVIGIILFSLIVTGFVYFMQSETTYYGVELDSEFDDVYENINSSIGIDAGAGLGNNMSSIMEQGESVDLQSSNFIMETASALKLPFTALKNIWSLITIISNKIGVPAWLFTAIISIIATLLSFLVLRAVLRSDII